MASEYKPNFGLVNLTASQTLTDFFAGSTITLNAAAGLTVTLPAATGTGAIYEFIVGTTVTSNDYIIQAASASDSFFGNAMLLADGGNTVVAFEAAATDDTITLDGSTTGGIAGMSVRVIDIASGKFHVEVVGAATGTEATPFSAAVS
jgi:hypothetical protein